MGVAPSGCFFVYGLNDGEKLLRPFFLFFLYSSSGLFVGMVKEVREMGEQKEFRCHRNEAVCIIGMCTCVTAFPGIVSRLRCVITDYTSGSLHPSSPVNRLNLPYI